ncbi:MAG: N-acetylmuramoyl-L-alanine amidase [Chitinophagaceae bacterium]|nr:MAG: N-acetylmuramoyl-L-alanine amidase [Chitinophagaceae bacterium]
MKRLLPLLFFVPVLFLFTRCHRAPYAETNKQYRDSAHRFAREIERNPAGQTMATAQPWVGAVNFNLRKPNIVVLHHTAQGGCDTTLRTFTLQRTQVSAHYVVCREGVVHHMLNDYLRAWHAGAGRWGNIQDVNSSSIGIEIDNNGVEPFSEAQLAATLQLLDTLRRKYAIPAANFIGHADVAPTRKNDPSVLFPWKRFADAGYGLWWSDTTNVQVPTGFNAIDALRIIGYDVRDSSAVFATFRRKYLGREAKGTLDADEQKVLYTLYRKFLQ